MRKLIAILLCSFSACFGQTIASRRLNLSSQTSIAFGAFSSVSPYNEANAYTAIPFAQALPSGTIISTNNFSSTSTFTNLPISGLTAPAFTVSGNVGTFNNTAGTQEYGAWLDTGTSYTLAIPNLWEQVYVNKATAVGTNFGQITMGISENPYGNNVQAIWCSSCANPTNASFGVEVSNTFTQLCTGASFTRPSAPYYLAMSLQRNTIAMYYSTNGTTWTNVGSCDLTSKWNFDTPTILNAFKIFLQIGINGVDSVQLSNLQTGLSGGVGLANCHLVIYPDGRPYSQGPLVYFTAYTPDVAATPQDGIFSYNVSTGAITQTGSIWGDNAGTIFSADSGVILYDPHNNTERLVTQEGVNNHYVLYASQSISTDDWLATGAHITPAMTQLSSSTGDSVYDPALACIQGWNPSTGSCSKWLLATADQSPGFPHGQTSTSDPSLNTWTTLFTDTANGNYEGAVITRTATTYSGNGVNYEACFGGVENSTTRSSRCYNMAGTYVAGLNITWPTAISPYNPSHPQMFCLGNKAYMLGFNNNSYNGVAQTLGNFIVATSATGCGQ